MMTDKGAEDMCTSYFIDNTKDDLYMASITRAVSSSGLAHRMREKLGRPITTYGRVKPGDIVVITAGVPLNTTGSTNLIKVQTVEGRA